MSERCAPRRDNYHFVHVSRQLADASSLSIFHDNDTQVGNGVALVVLRDKHLQHSHCIVESGRSGTEMSMA